MKPNNIDLNKLFVFSSVIRHHGYRGASEELHLTKAAISQSITTLEAQLGKKLFLRVGNRLKPTAEALQFQNDLQAHRFHLQKALDQFLAEKKSLTGELRIGAYFEFTKSKLMPVVEKFLSDHPLVSLRFRFESPSRLQRLLMEDKIDLSISIYPHRGVKSVRSHRLIQQELILVYKHNNSSSYPETSWTIKDIQKLPIIDYFSDHILFSRWLQHFYGKNNIRPNVRIFAASAEMVLEFIRRGLGAGVVPRYVAEPYLSNRELVAISPKKERLFDYIWLNEQKEEPILDLQKEFSQRLKTSFPTII